MLLRLVSLMLMAIGFCTVVHTGPPEARGDDNGSSVAGPAEQIRVLIVTGGHEFPDRPFRDIFAGYSDMDCTFLEEKVGGEAFNDIKNWPYDVIVFYNFMKNLSEEQQTNFLRLSDRGVGLVILHHGIYGYRPWPEFQKIVGVTSWLSGNQNDVNFKVHVEDPQHPITRGLKDFSIHDETYQGHAVDPKVHVLLSTDEPTNAHAIGWVHTYRKSPVCYFQLGHDTNAYANDSYVTILGRAIRWSAGRSNAPETTGSTPRPGAVR